MEVLKVNEKDIYFPYIKISQQKDYCMICRKWVNNGVNHKCPIKHRALIDDNMVGIVDKLYNLGIVPMMAMFNLDSTGKTPEAYNVNIIIDLSEHLRCEVLRALPVNWQYCWDEGGIHGLEYTDCRDNLDAESADEQVNAVIKEFEVFLDNKDSAATKALTLLTSY